MPRLLLAIFPFPAALLAQDAPPEKPVSKDPVLPGTAIVARTTLKSIGACGGFGDASPRSTQRRSTF